MRRVTYKSVLGKASSLFTGEVTPTTEDETLLNVFLNRRAGEFWELFWWPELTPAEKRTFRQPWSVGLACPAETEVYFIASGKYYVALTLATAQAPATRVGGEYETNLEFWAESQGSYEGAEEYDAGTTYARGDQVYYPDTDEFYQLHAGDSLGNAPTDVDNWGRLVPLVRNIEYEQSWETTAIGEVKAVWDRDPYLSEEWERCRIEFDLTDRGVVVRGEQGVVWVEFRRRVPSWSATVTPAQHSMSTTYGLNAQVYDDTEGDYFKSLQAGNAGHAVTAGAWWERIEFPYVLRECVPQGAYADMLDPDGANEKYTLEDAKAQNLAKREMRKITQLQRQSRQLNVVGR